MSSKQEYLRLWQISPVHLIVHLEEIVRIFTPLRHTLEWISSYRKSLLLLVLTVFLFFRIYLP